MTDDELAVVRRAFGRQMVGRNGIKNPGLEAAFAAVRREDFLAAGDWHITAGSGGYRKLPANDPVYVYQDLLFGLQRERGVNNGSPSLHAWMLHHLAPRPGDRVAHIGAGTGYYTAVLAELVGSAGHVTAVEFDQELADLACKNMSGRPNVTVVQGDGALWPAEAVDCVYVNFAVSGPAEPWIERLAPRGRLVFPLGAPDPAAPSEGPTHSIRGAALKVERREHGLAAQSLCPAFFVYAEGALAGDAGSREALFRAFEGGDIDRVRSLRWKTAPDPERSWLITPEWSLSFDPVENTTDPAPV